MAAHECGHCCAALWVVSHAMMTRGILDMAWLFVTCSLALRPASFKTCWPQGRRVLLVACLYHALPRQERISLRPPFRSDYSTTAKYLVQRVEGHVMSVGGTWQKQHQQGWVCQWLIMCAMHTSNEHQVWIVWNSSTWLAGLRGLPDPYFHHA